MMYSVDTSYSKIKNSLATPKLWASNSPNELVNSHTNYHYGVDDASMLIVWLLTSSFGEFGAHELDVAWLVLIQDNSFPRKITFAKILLVD